MKKRLLLALTVVLLITVIVATLAACRKKPTDNTVKTIYDVSMGTTAVGTAIEKAVQVENAENLYLAFTFVIDKGADSYDEVYEFAALLDLDNDQNCTLSFKSYTDIQNAIFTEVYYKNGTLYLNKQPAIDHAAISGVSLSQIASTLATSAQSGQIDSILQVLPAVGDRVFSACERVEEGGKATYTFTVDYQEIGACIAHLVAQTGILNQADMTRLLGLADVDTAAKTQISFVTESVEGVGEVFVSADCRTTHESGTASETVTAKSLRSFTCKVLSDAAAQQSQYQVSMPDNLSSFGYTHPANLNLLGTLTLDVSSASRAAYIGAQPLTLSLYNYQYVWDFSLQSNVDALGNWTANFVLTNQQNRERHIGLYYAEETLYLDLSSLSMGSWKLPASTLQDIAASLGRARSRQTLTAADYRDVILDLLVDRVEESEKVTYTIKSDAFVKLYNAVQETLTQNAILTLPPIAVDGAQLVVDTKNNAFRTLVMSASVWGSTVKLSASNPSVGAPQTIAVPQWVANSVNPLQSATITPTARGILRAYTAANSNTALVEALIESLSGTAVDLGDEEIYYYNFAANVGGNGKINAISVDFDTDHNERVCSLYYHKDSPDRFCVIMPTAAVGAKTQVYSLALKDEMRYVDFVRAINGNQEIRDVAECTLSNTQSSLSFTWSNAGLEATLERLASIFSAQSVTSVPNDLGLQALRVTIGGEKAVRLMFASDRFIEFGIDTMSISDADLSLTYSLSHGAVSYFDAYNLSDTIAVSVGDGSATRRAITVALADFDTEWTFDDQPALGSGNQMVTAHCTVLGQRVNLSFGMDCAAPSEVEVLNSRPAYAAYLDNKTFTFDRYAAVDSPLEVVAAFRTAKIIVGGKARELALVWQRNGVDIDRATWDNPVDNANNSDYVILPTVKNFFGNMVSLDGVTGQYTLRLSGAKITTVKNAATFLTLATYGTDPYDPFDSATYDAAEIVFQTATGLTVDGVIKKEWDIDSIRNKAFSEGGIKDSATNNVYSTEALKAALKEKLYALSGKYAIDLNVINSLNVTEKSIAVTIMVTPYVVREVTFEQLSDGVSFDKTIGRFAVVTRAVTAIPYNYAFAKVAVVTFENNEIRRFDAKDWTVAPIDNVVMFKEYTGEVKLTLGDAAGGKQTLALQYAVAAEPVDGVGVWGYDKHGAKQELAGSLKSANAATTALSFTFEHLDPYDYILPAGLAVHHESDVEYVEHTFTFAGWDENVLWHNSTPYVTTENVYNVAVSISLSFDQKFVGGEWSFAGMVEDAEGTYVFDSEGGDFILYNAAIAAHRRMTRYSPVATPATVYQKSKSGAYVYYTDWVRYDSENPNHNGLDRYTKDTILATPYVYVEAADGAYVKEDGVHVAYDADKHQGKTRYNRAGTANVIYREGTDGLSRLVLDPNKVDYLSTEAYPALVVVKFTDNTYAVLEAVWNLSALASVSPEQDYTETVALYIPKNQFLADVYMRIESTKPKSTYYRVDLKEQKDEHGDVVTDEHGNPVYEAELDEHGDPLLDEHGNVVYKAKLSEDGFYINGQNEVTLTLLGTELGEDGKVHLVVNDLTSEARLHGIICGCDKEGCKGYLYFDYGDSTTENARFAITEWKNLSAIADALRAAAQENKDVPLQELSFSVSVIAVAHNSENSLTIHVQASNLSDIVYTEAGMPLVASSMSSAGTSVYSMEAVGTALTVDPYVADIFSAANYPKELQFTLGDKTGYAYVDSWDLSALAGVTPYNGASTTVYAQIATPFGNVRVAAPITVKRRIIQSVKVDGSANRFIYVNAMSAQPFGPDILEENGRTYAQKTVEVKFEGDDLAYHMTMRYDITDYVAPYYPTALSSAAIDIAVGNAAGGYQTISGYRVFTNANYVMTVKVPEDDPAYPLLKAYLKDGGGNWDGVLYDGYFVAFDDSDAANDAWRALTIANKTLVLSCGFLDQNDLLQVTDYRAKLWADEADLGVLYRWERASMGGVDVLRLVVWNKVAEAQAHVDTVQYVSTETNRYIHLARGMLNVSGVDASSVTRAYKHTFTVQNLLDLHVLSVVGELFTVGDLTSALYVATDTTYTNPLDADAVLTVGEYVWHISIGEHEYYRGAVDIAVTVTPCTLTSVNIYVVRVENAGIKIVDNSTLLAGYNYSLSSGTVLDIKAEDDACAIYVEYYDGESAKMDASPYLPGTYTVKFVTADAGYAVDLGGGANSFTLTIID